MVIDHQTFENLFQNCFDWVEDLSGRLSVCRLSDGNRSQLDSKMVKLEEFLSHREEGNRKVQQVVDASAVVLPHTSSVGRDLIGQNVAELQHLWETTVSEVDESKLEVTRLVTQWRKYEDCVDQLAKWMTNTEAQVKAETQLDGTAANKKAHLERLKVMPLIALDCCGGNQMIELLTI